MSAVGAPAEAPQESGRSRLLWFVGIGYLFYILADSRDGIAKLAVKYTLKDELHMDAAAIAQFGLIVSIAWYLKPLAGIVTDTISIRGSRRKAYVVLTTGIAALLYLTMALAPSSEAVLMVSLIAMNFALVFAQTTLGGVMVEAGQRFGLTGRLSSIRNAAEGAGVLIASVLAGVFAAKTLAHGHALSYVSSFALLATMSVLALLVLKEDKTEGRGLEEFKERLSGFKTLFESKAMWATSFFWLLVRFSPGFQTPLFVHQSETLKFSSEFIGGLGAIQASGNVVASLVYVWACRKYSLRSLVIVGILVNAVSSVCYLGYTSQSSAVAIEALYGLGNGLAFMPFLDLIARSTPKKFEALGYALIFAFGNISLFGSDAIGSTIYEAWHRNFSGMVWMNTATSLLALLAVPLLPKVLLAAKEGQAHVGDVAVIKEVGEPD